MAVSVLLFIGLLVAASAIPALGPWRWAFLGLAAVIAVVFAVVFIRGQLSQEAAREAEALSAFERAVLAEIHAESPAKTRETTPAPPAAEIPKPSPEVPATPGVEGLLKQLRLARMDPLFEGEVREGPFSGATILRLGRHETALVLTRPPSAEEWPQLFPRYDRVFVPQADGKWFAAERLEELLRARLDLRI
jgi:hypothetical protein